MKRKKRLWVKKQRIFIVITVYSLCVPGVLVNVAVIDNEERRAKINPLSQVCLTLDGFEYNNGISLKKMSDGLGAQVSFLLKNTVSEDERDTMQEGR